MADYKPGDRIKFLVGVNAAQGKSVALGNIIEVVGQVYKVKSDAWITYHLTAKEILCHAHKGPG